MHQLINPDLEYNDVIPQRVQGVPLLVQLSGLAGQVWSRDYRQIPKHLFTMATGGQRVM